MTILLLIISVYLYMCGYALLIPNAYMPSKFNIFKILYGNGNGIDNIL